MLSTNMSTFIVILLSVSSCFCRSLHPSGEADQVDHQLDEEVESLSLCAFLSEIRDMLTLTGATICTDLKKEDTSGAVHEFCIESGQKVIRDSLSKPGPVKSLEDKVKALSVSAPLAQCFCSSLHYNFEAVVSTIDLLCHDKMTSSEDRYQQRIEAGRQNRGGIGGTISGAVVGIFTPYESLNTDPKSKVNKANLDINWKVDYKTGEIDIKWDVEKSGLGKQDIESTVNALKNALKETYFPGGTKDTTKSTKSGPKTNIDISWSASVTMSPETQAEYNSYYTAVQNSIDQYKRQLAECQESVQGINPYTSKYNEVQYLCGYLCKCDESGVIAKTQPNYFKRPSKPYY